jgi:serine/threonine-protein kinase RsbW
MSQRQSNTPFTVRVRQRVPSRTEELHRVRQIVEQEAMSFGFDQETAFRLALAVDEACTNIIKHAYEGNPGRAFDLEIATTENQFRIVLTDEGKGFSPSKLPRLDMKHYFERMCRGGLGVHIIKLVMDDVDYAVAQNKYNRLSMTKYRQAAGA